MSSRVSLLHILIRPIELITRPNVLTRIMAVAASHTFSSERAGNVPNCNCLSLGCYSFWRSTVSTDHTPTWCINLFDGLRTLSSLPLKTSGIVCSNSFVACQHTDTGGRSFCRRSLTAILGRVFDSVDRIGCLSTLGQRKMNCRYSRCKVFRSMISGFDQKIMQERSLTANATAKHIVNQPEIGVGDASYN
jgi:hypothetical protein